MLAQAAAAAASSTPESSSRAVRQAIVAAIQSRCGDGLSVSLGEIDAAGLDGESAIVATPMPGGRTGAVIAFAISRAAPGTLPRRIGSATARVALSGPHLVAARPLSRGAVLTAGDLREETGSIDDVLLRPLPDREALAGARLRRDVAEGTILTDALVQAVPLVRSGDVVTAHARVDGIEAEGRAIASQSGTAGEIIRLVNPDSRHPLRGRIVGPGRVEVIE